MAININAKTSGVGGLETTADNSGNINIQSGGSTVMSVTSSGVAVTGSFSQNGAVYSTQPSFRNLIINGDMKIDQRNAGASVTPTNGQYNIDRWNTYVSQASKFTIQQNAGSVTPPAGFTNYIGVTSSSSYSVVSGDYFLLSQSLEGLNTAHLGWGTTNAKTVTLSFWVRSSLTGTFGGSIQNNGQTRSYPFIYTISSANTWEYKTITVTGDTTGTWLTTNGRGIWLFIGLGNGTTFSGTAGSWSGNNYTGATGATSVVGTSGATFYITGVQLEVGSTATDFENLPYDVQLQRCQRYYEKSYNSDTAVPTATDTGSYMFLANRNPGLPHTVLIWKTTKRTTPTVSLYNSQTNATGSMKNLDTAADQAAAASRIGANHATLYSAVSTSLGEFLQFHYTADAEL